MILNGKVNGDEITVVAGKVESYADGVISVGGAEYTVTEKVAERLSKQKELEGSVIMTEVTDDGVRSFKRNGMYTLETQGEKADGTPVTNYLKIFTGQIRNFKRIERDDKAPFARGTISFPIWHNKDGKWSSETMNADIYFFGDIVDEKCQELAENLEQTITVVTRRRVLGDGDNRKAIYVVVDDGLYLY